MTAPELARRIFTILDEDPTLIMGIMSPFAGDQEMALEDLTNAVRTQFKDLIEDGPQITPKAADYRGNHG